MYKLLNVKFQTDTFEPYEGVIQIGNNVLIGSDSIIMPDVKIGNNVVIAAGSIVTKDIPDNSVAAGVPCKVIGSFDSIVEKRKKVRKMSPNELWEIFEEKHNN